MKEKKSKSKEEITDRRKSKKKILLWQKNIEDVIIFIPIDIVS